MYALESRCVKNVLPTVSVPIVTWDLDLSPREKKLHLSNAYTRIRKNGCIRIEMFNM